MISIIVKHNERLVGLDGKGFDRLGWVDGDLLNGGLFRDLIVTM